MNNIITSLRLKHYRSYDDFAVEFSPTVNIVLGPNASGKTNLLESVLLLCGGSSFRAHLPDVVYHGQEWARIEATLTDRTRSMLIEKTSDSAKKRYTINDTHRVRLRYEDILPVVLFEPEDMRLLTGPPDMRRDFMDEILSSTDPVFNSAKKQYARVLNQRNRLLKQPISVIKNQIFIWNIRLSELAGYIVSARHGLLEMLNESVSDVYGTIAGKDSKVTLRYVSSLPKESYETRLLNMLESRIDDDIERGFTSFGPHRDDFFIELVGASAKTTASRGETRTLVLSLKLLEIRLVEEKRSTAPLVLLDDVFSELDGSRRKSLTNYLKNHQTIITTTDADVIAKDFAQTANTISLS